MCFAYVQKIIFFALPGAHVASRYHRHRAGKAPVPCDHRQTANHQGRYSSSIPPPLSGLPQWAVEYQRVGEGLRFEQDDGL